MMEPVDKKWEEIAEAIRSKQDWAQPEKPSIRKAHKLGVGYNALLNAYDSEKARLERGNRLSRLLSMTHLLMTESIHLIDEAESMMDKTVKNEKHFKYNLQKINFYFNDYVRHMDKLISPSEMRNFRLDWECFDANVRSFAKLEGWKEATEEQKMQNMKERIKNLHKDVTEKLAEYKETYGEEKYSELIGKLKDVFNE